MSARPNNLIFLEHLINQLSGLKQSLQFLVELLVKWAKTQFALSRWHVLETLEATERLVVGILKAPVLDLEKLNH